MILINEKLHLSERLPKKVEKTSFTSQDFDFFQTASSLSMSSAFRIFAGEHGRGVRNVRRRFIEMSCDGAVSCIHHTTVEDDSIDLKIYHEWRHDLLLLAKMWRIADKVWTKLRKARCSGSSFTNMFLYIILFNIFTLVIVARITDCGSVSCWPRHHRRRDVELVGRGWAEVGRNQVAQSLSPKTGRFPVSSFHCNLGPSTVQLGFFCQWSLHFIHDIVT